MRKLGESAEMGRYLDDSKVLFFILTSLRLFESDFVRPRVCDFQSDSPSTHSFLGGVRFSPVLGGFVYAVTQTSWSFEPLII